MASKSYLVGEKFGELLTTLGLIEKDDLGRALAIQDNTGKHLDSILIENEMVQEEVLLKTVADSLGIEYVDVAKLKIPDNALDLIPIRLVHKYNIIPYAKEDGVIKIITADPINYQALDDLQLMTKCQIEPILGLSLDITSCIKNYYGIGADTVDSMNAENVNEGLEVIGKEEREDIGDASEDASVIRFVNQIIMEAISDRATDIHVEPFEDELRIRYRIDGLLYEAAIPPTIKHYQEAVISRVKIMSDMNIAEKRLPQDGRIDIRAGGNEYDFRVSTVPTPFGESISIRILNRTSTIYNLEELGMDEYTYNRFSKMLDKPHGIILVTGPTGSGKTTTLYASLAKLNKIDVKIITIEEPIEYRMKGITQIQVMPKIGLTFASILRSLLRQDPDIMLVGETRDYETAEITIRTALTGHLVFSTLHTNDAAGAVARMLDMGVEPFLVASSVIGIMAQRLVRKICPQCKEEYKPKSETLLALGLKPDVGDRVKMYHGKGCEACKFLGYKGRVGIYEIFPISEAIRTITMDRKSASVIKEQALKEGMKTLRQDGWEKVKAGVTTIEEVLRVTQEDALESTELLDLS